MREGEKTVAPPGKDWCSFSLPPILGSLSVPWGARYGFFLYFSTKLSRTGNKGTKVFREKTTKNTNNRKEIAFIIQEYLKLV